MRHWSPSCCAPYNGHFTTDRSLPFLEANYKIMPNWSVYAQYAQGIYVPDISAFEQKNPVDQFPKAETTTNYQVGTVYYADNFTADGDLYYIPINNNFVSVPCQQVGGPSGDTCFVNTGQALYKGVEGEATYAFSNDFMGGFFNGLVVFVNGSINSGKSNGLYVKQAPTWTSAGGLIYKMNAVEVLPDRERRRTTIFRQQRPGRLQGPCLQQYGCQHRLWIWCIRAEHRSEQRVSERGASWRSRRTIPNFRRTGC